MTLRFHREAIRETNLAQVWYDQVQDGLGDDFAAQFDEALASILDRPTLWPRDESAGSRREVRSRTIGPFSYKVVYEIRDEEIIVLAIAHLHREPGSWANRKA